MQSEQEAIIAKFGSRFKPEFITRYSKLTDFELFKLSSLKFLRRSIRVNTLKIKKQELMGRLEGDWRLVQVPWCEEGFFIEHKKEERRDVGNLIEHSLGYFYVQESMSMLPVQFLELKENDVVLDMCAAPGSKSTQIAAAMKNKGVLIANDSDYKRLKALTINLQRCGVMNCIVNLSYGHLIKGSFDKILVDAPCSATGAIRKSLKTIEMWNPKIIKRMAGMQKRLLISAFNNLKDNGILVYSTCSVEPEENEGVVNFLLERFDNIRLEKTDISGLKMSPTILEFEGAAYSWEIKKCLRIWPQDNDTSGFFVSKIRKL